MTHPAARSGRGSAAIALALLLTSCARSPDSRDTGNPVIRAMAEQPGLSEYQKGLLEDGRLTFPEYEQAVFRTVGCLEAAGFHDIRTELRSQSRGYTIDVAFPDGVSPEIAEASLDECFDESLSVVQVAFAEENRPTEAEQARMEDRRRECARVILVEHGLHSEEELGPISDEQFAEAASVDAARLANCLGRP